MSSSWTECFFFSPMLTGNLKLIRYVKKDSIPKTLCDFLLCEHVEIGLILWDSAPWLDYRLKKKKSDSMSSGSNTWSSFKSLLLILRRISSGRFLFHLLNKNCNSREYFFWQIPIIYNLFCRLAFFPFLFYI